MNFISKSLTIVALVMPMSLAAQSKFSKAEVLEDLKAIKWSLQNTHYDMYAYTSGQEFNQTYQTVKGSITKDSMSLLEVVNTLQPVVSVLDIGHTNINFPIASYMEYAQGGGTLFPLEIAFEYDKPLIRKNWSTNEQIEIGSELLSINGVAIDDILNEMYPNVAAERPYFKKAKIELYSFPRFYWQVFGEQESFEVEIATNGTVEKYKLKAISLIEDYEMKRNEVLNASMQLKFLDESAYINPGNFSGDEAKYQSFIDSAFVEINKNQNQNLIIDFRNNGGGDNSFSDYLISYFANKPSAWASKFSLKNSKIMKDHARANYDTTTTFWQTVLSNPDDEIFSYDLEPTPPQSVDKRYKGKVYVLVNRQSHSQSTVAAAQIQDNGFGTIVGEETGEYPTLYASIFQYELPNTGITVNISKGQIIRANGSMKEEGVIPDIKIKDYLLDEKDEILEGLLNHIRNES